ncbi:hypothetical protein N658DRAFT_483037 [Parathielavia hyrcaniae]|uniref:Uncharacterized protein n=1 Tax=Parathielavia hyrcaniae TaxID=113614 RepID=A0AAN6QB80_9PEZI|nr:hypothetical protein N658DRAFT_483037 [Parathielavia hyrcaniae]
MAPLIAQAAELAKRAGGCGDDRYRGSDGGCYWYNYHSGWYYWGRWPQLPPPQKARPAASARDRLDGTRAASLLPASAAVLGAGPEPRRSPPPGGYKYGSGDGYYGGNQQQEGIQLEQPANAYHRGSNQDYAPPPGPPPNAAR